MDICLYRVEIDELGSKISNEVFIRFGVYFLLNKKL